MNSLSLMRLLVVRNGSNALVRRQLSVYSLNCLKRNSQKLLTNDLNHKIELKSIGTQLSRNCVRVMATSVDHKSDHNHSKIWSLERYLSIGLLAVIPAAFVVHNPVMDYLLSVALITHIHWGFEAIVVDYVRPTVFGSVLPKIALGSVYLLSILAVGGLFYFNYSDVGLVTAIRMIAKS